jgi:hypothetical protein
MSTLGGMIRYSMRSRSKNSKNSNWLPKEKWIDKMKKEGKWKDYKNNEK